MSKPSSIVDKNVQPINTSGQFQAPTWSLVLILVIVLFVLKRFIYIKDQKRHGK